MEKLLSSRCNLHYVPESYILPPESRPEEKEAPLCNIVPVIDFGGGELGSDISILTQQIIKASQEFGFFQLVNHGIPIKLLDDVMQVAREFFQLPIEEKASLYSEDPKQSCRLFTSIDYANEDVHYWRDTLRHHSHPLHEHIQNWPHNPTRYQDVIGSYSVKVRKLSLQLLDLICTGLGLDSGYFNDELSSVQLMTINHYPPCPDPSLTLGLPKHSDANLITLRFHRVVTSKRDTRTTVSSFIHPSQNCLIEPAKALVDDDNSPPLYKSFEYKSFIRSYTTDTHARLPPLERYKLK